MVCHTYAPPPVASVQWPTAANSGGTVYWLYLLEYSDSEGVQTRFWKPSARRSRFCIRRGKSVPVTPEHGRSDTKSADSISFDPDLSGGCRYPILEALEQEKPFPVSCLYRSGKGVHETKRTRFLLEKNKAKQKNVGRSIWCGGAAKVPHRPNVLGVGACHGSRTPNSADTIPSDDARVLANPMCSLASPLIA